MATREPRAKKGGAGGRKSSSKTSSNGRLTGGALDSGTLVGFYRMMFSARRTDDREIQMKRQNKIFFQISGAGHEAVQVAMAHHLRPGRDWFYFYYRDRALSQALGMTPYDHLLQAVGAESDPASGGRQMPSHWGHRDLRIVSTSSPTGTQYLHAVGTAEGAWRAGQLEEMRAAIEAFEDDEVVLCTTGEGQTSEGEFWEALNTATNLKLPVVFLVEDNGYAISVPVEVNTPGGKISEVVKGFPNLYIEEVDGCDVLASVEAAGRAVDYARQRKGPALLHAHVIRPYSHSMSDDERMYRTEKEREADAARDPLVTYRQWLMDEGHLDEAGIEALEAEVNAGIQDAADRALEQPQPAAETAMKHLYSEEVDPTSSEFDTEDSPAFEGEETTMVDLLNACMRDEMARDPRIVMFGEDVADASRDVLGEVKGKGGVFKVTWGLQQKFGGLRVFNSPLAEANIVGRAIGMALRGVKPVVEIQFFDYIWTAFMQLRNELATMRYRSGGSWDAPVVVRVTYGGYLKGGAIYHSQTGETLFTHSPGLRVIMPSNALDANGLLRTAIRCDDPVIFLEHKHLYRQVYNKARYPGPDFMIPFGKAKVVREGTDLTVVTCGALVKRSLDAARMAGEQDGTSVEVIDLRSLSPLDMETIAASVKKTNKVIVAYEDSLSWGIGSEIAARIADETFEWLDGPVKRVASLDTWVAYAPQLEAAILPDADRVLTAIRELASY
jgi:2-oxoisovalerate dehydrogenase E1 component